MKKIAILVILFCAYNFLNAQNNRKETLHIKIVSHEGVEEEDNYLNNLLKNIVQETSLQNDYRDVDMRHTGYNDDDNFLTEHSVIGQFSPTKYITTQKELGDKIKPLFVVAKVGDESDGYYHCAFITSKDSKIENLERDFKNIKRFYFVNRKSTAGYTYAINELYELKLIDEPCWCKLNNVEVFFTNEHKFVQESVAKDEYAVGAVWLPDTSMVNILKIVSRRISQDVIFVTNDLYAKYKDTITYWFQKSIQEHPDFFVNSSQRISKLIEYNDKREGDYEEIYKIFKKVKEADEYYCEDKTNLWWFVKRKEIILITLFVTAAITLLTEICWSLWRYGISKFKSRKKKKKTK
ncbi:hypothetical protein FACS1894178_2160 [Bacteroidia bacterium]|nr:hypothetical protein FACS1894178_2160 [Bacteroidia bacterium]